MSRWLRPIVVAAAALAVVPATALSYGKKDSDHGKKGYGKEDTARYILPPGNFGGLPDHRRLDGPASALRRAHAAARQRHRRRTSSS